MAQFLSGSLTSQANPAVALANVIENALSAAGWTKPVADVVDPSSGSYTNRVWKCPAALSGYTSDFYLILGVATAAGGTNLMVNAAEAIDGTTNKFFRYAWNAPTINASDASPTTASAYPATVTGSAPGTNTTNFTYMVVVTKRGIFLKTSDSTTPIYAGLFESFGSAQANEFPLCRGTLQDQSSNSLFFSRRPTVTTYTNNLFSGSANFTRFQIGDAAVPSLVGSELYGAVFGNRVGIQHTGVFTGGTQRGLAYDCLSFKQATTVNPGDTLTVGSDTYVYFMSAGYSQGLWVNTSAV